MKKLKLSITFLSVLLGSQIFAQSSQVIKSYIETYKDIAITIADKLQAPFLIVDLIVYDHTQSAREDNYVFLEINTSPALKMYYGARNRVYFDIVSVLGAMIDRHYHEHSGIDT